MEAETILLAFGFDRPAGEYRSVHTPNANCWLRFERRTQTGLRVGFFLLFFSSFFDS